MRIAARTMTPDSIVNNGFFVDQAVIRDTAVALIKAQFVCPCT